MRPILPPKPLWATVILGLGLATSAPAAAQARLAIIPSHSFDSRALAEGWALALGGELRRAGAQVTPSRAIRADLVWPTPPGDPPAAALGVFAVSHSLPWIAELEPSDGPHSGMVRVLLMRPSDGAIKGSRSFPLTSRGAHAAASALADLLGLSSPQEGPSLSQDVLSRLGQASLESHPGGGRPRRAGVSQGRNLERRVHRRGRDPRGRSDRGCRLGPRPGRSGGGHPPPQASSWRPPIGVCLLRCLRPPPGRDVPRPPGQARGAVSPVAHGRRAAGFVGLQPG